MHTKKSVTVGCIQTNTGTDLESNLRNVKVLLDQARRSGAEMLLTPENVDVMLEGRARTHEYAQPEQEHTALHTFQQYAQELECWLLVGSLSVKSVGGKVYKRSYMLDCQGVIQARYDKIHMFDVSLSQEETHRESATYEAGDRAIVVQTPWGGLGMTICYDVRFARLYRDLAHTGAVMMSVPSAFTVPTGSAHWHVLLRTRAIETGSYVFAPAQCGMHANGRRTYGHSIIIDPWGKILAEAQNTIGFLTATLDLTRVTEVRRQLPCLQHDRQYSSTYLHQ